MVLVIATAGLIYELAMAAVASYVLGDSVTQFSLVIGAYLSALGAGAYLSRFVERDLSLRFVDVELAAGLVGGLSAPGLFLAFSYTGAFELILYSTVVLVGVLVGLELPLLIRILKDQLELKELIARALTFDYAGALLGSLAFSLLLMPKLGLVQTTIVCGLLNAGVGLIATWVLRHQVSPPRLLRARLRAVFVLAALGLAWLQADNVTKLSERGLFGEVVLARDSAYQRILLAKRGEAVELYLNGHLQFSSADEHRYHEALVHPPMASAARRRRVLVGGGGDGLAAREVLKWPDVEQLVVVDIDPVITDLARLHATLIELNRSALNDPRTLVVNQDAMRYLQDTAGIFDVIILDFPDPTSYSLGKLYSKRFYDLASARLSKTGAMSVQATSPLFAPSAYWCIAHTLEASGFEVRPYHAFVPSFGEWGFVLATARATPPPTLLPPEPLRFLSQETLAGLFHLPRDIRRVPTLTNSLNNQVLVAYYNEEWSEFR